MKFSKAQKRYQEKLNEKILAEWEDALSYYNEYDRLYYPKWERLNHCNAYICYLDHYVFLKSYNTIVAFFDYYNYILYDVLRYEYGYTSTSAQHISKFRNEMRYAYHLSPNEIEECRYYPI